MVRNCAAQRNLSICSKPSAKNLTEGLFHTKLTIMICQVDVMTTLDTIKMAGGRRFLSYMIPYCIYVSPLVCIPLHALH